MKDIEIGPIRPPSESNSLLIRVTRGCHWNNLLLEIRGNLRTEKQEMLSTIDRFLTLPPDERLLFAVGRRLNIFFRLDDLKNPKLHQKAEESLQQILSKNPHVDFAALCNYVRQSQI